MIGDVLVSSIICNNLRKALPDAQIDYMLYESTIPVIEGNKAIDNLIVFKEEYRKNKWSFLKFIMSIRREKYDIVIDAYSKLESWLTVLFSGAKTKISYQKRGRSFLYSHNIKLIERPKTNLGLTIERRLSLLAPLHLNIAIDPIPKLYVSPNENEFAKKLLTTHGVDSTKKTIMVSIIGSSDNKTYPLSEMSKVLDFIIENAEVNLLFNYFPNQIDDAKFIYNHCKKTTQNRIYFDVLGKNLRAYISLMNNCDFIIGNDGGAINIAKSLNKPSFIIFSPWIDKRIWATFEDGKFHKSVHLKDYRPELFIGKSEKELKKEAIQLYKNFKSNYFLNELKSFLDYNLTENRTFLLKDIIIDNKLDNKLSVLIITLNEIENIDSLIKNVKFADEIVVIDAFSTDGTVDAVKKHKSVKLIQHKFLNFSDQRNFALEQASYNWVLFIDGDERLSKELELEISEVYKEPHDIVAFGFYRKFYFENTPLRFSGYQTDKVYRLFNKDFVNYNKEKLVHETLDVDGKTKILKNKLHHYSYKDDSTYRDKIIIYAQLRAKELFIKKLKPTFYHFYIKPFYRFGYHFIIRAGFLDGTKGYKISKLNAFEVKQRYIELRELYKKM